MSGTVPGFNLTVTCDGSDVRAKSVRVRRDAAKMGTEWEVHLEEPMVLSPIAQWTIERSFAGYSQTLISNATPWSRSGQNGVEKSTRIVSGVAYDSQSHLLKEYCIPLTYVFFNPTWLKSVDPTAKVIDGIIKTAALRTKPERLINDRLPGKEIQDDQFKCIPANTHLEIGQHLARLIGFSFRANTPPVPLLDTFTVPSGTTWANAFKMNYEPLWQPVFEFEEKNFYVLDYLTDVSSVLPIQIISIDNPAIVSVSDRVSVDKDHIVDHVIILGRKSNVTTGNPLEDPDFTPVIIPEVAVSIDRVIPISSDLTRVMGQLQMPDQTPASYGDPNKPIVPYKGKRVDVLLSVHCIHNPIRGDKWIPVQEEHKVYDANNNVISKTVVEHKYSADFRPVRSIERQYISTVTPGISSPSLVLLSVKTTNQNKFVRPLNCALTSELIEKVILYESAVKGGVTFKDSLAPMDQVIRTDYMREAIETNSDTKQATLTMPANFKNTDIYRMDDNLMLKRDLDYDVLAGNVKMQSQILENPVRMMSIQTREAVFRREYYRDVVFRADGQLINFTFSTDPNNGDGELVGNTRCYHEPRTINHQDISTDLLAKQVAQRAFGRSPDIDHNKEIVIKMPLPLPLHGLMYKVQIPDYTAIINQSPVTIPGGLYVMRSYEENITWSDDGEVRDEQTITVRERP